MIKSIVLTRFCDILVILFNGIMKISYFPKCWKTGFIAPIFKSGEFSDPGNYRGIMHQSIPSTNIPPPPPAIPGVLHSTAAPGPGFILDDLPRGPGFCISIKLRLVQ